MTPSPKLEIVNYSDTGLIRPHNEDSTIADSDLGLVVLADGIGGHEGGEVASTLAVTEIFHNVSNSLKDIEKNNIDAKTGFHNETLLLRDTIVDANTRIFDTAKQEQQYSGMGTTIVAGLFFDNKMAIAHVGDSRLYRFRNNELKQITSDHSLIQELINSGTYTPEEAHAKTPKNLVTRAMGIESKVEVGLAEESVLPADIYLLCSDGLNDMIKDEEIGLIISKYSINLAQIADNLVQSANQHGGKDNISVILIRVLGGDTPSPSGLFGKFVNIFKKT